MLYYTMLPTPSPVVNSVLIAHWFFTLMFRITTGVEDNTDLLTFVFSPRYNAVLNSITHELTCSPYQTPFTLFHTVVFAFRFYSQTSLLAPADFGVTDAVEDVLMTVHTFYLIALQAIGGIPHRYVESLAIGRLANQSEYDVIWQNLTRAIACPRTGTTQIGLHEWESCLAEISRLTTLMPRVDADPDDMPATIIALLQYMQISSRLGTVPLSRLPFIPFPQQPNSMLPPNVDFTEPSSQSLSKAAPPSSCDEWNPANDPIVDTGRRKTRNIAPGSTEAVDLNTATCAFIDFAYYCGHDAVYEPMPGHAIQARLTGRSTVASSEEISSERMASYRPVV